MAAGDTKLKVQEIRITRAAPVAYVAFWQLFVENKLGADVLAASGLHEGSFGLPAVFRAMTGLQMETQVKADIAAAAQTPAHDVLT